MKKEEAGAFMRLRPFFLGVGNALRMSRDGIHVG